MALQPLWWIKFDDLCAAVAGRDELKDVEVTSNKDNACLRETIPQLEFWEMMAFKDRELRPVGSVKRAAEPVHVPVANGTAPAAGGSGDDINVEKMSIEKPEDDVTL